MRRFFWVLACIALLSNTLYAQEIQHHAHKKKVFISQIVEHAAISATTKGIIDGLAKEGFHKDKNLELRVESAQGSAALAAQIATKFIHQKPDVVVGVGTVTAQSFAKYARENKTFLVFSSVTDPLSAQLVKSLNKPEYHTSGVSNFVALEPQIQLFKTIQPKLKNLGFLYNAGEANSVSLVKQLEAIASKFGITIVKQTVSKTSEISQAATKLAQRTDAIFISNDNTALSALPSIVRSANERKIPVYVSDTDAVQHGALAALGPNQYEVGLQTATIVARGLRGEDVGHISVEFPSKTELFLNLDAAHRIGISIAEDVKSKATVTIEQNSTS